MHPLLERLFTNRAFTRLIRVGEPVLLRYVGRRTGRVIELTVWAKRSGADELLISVATPTKKTWWRNFRGDGQPVAVRIGDHWRDGHGVTEQSDRSVKVRIRFPDSW